MVHNQVGEKEISSSKNLSWYILPGTITFNWEKLIFCCDEGDRILPFSKFYQPYSCRSCLNCCHYSFKNPLALVLFRPNNLAIYLYRAQSRLTAPCDIPVRCIIFQTPSILYQITISRIESWSLVFAGKAVLCMTSHWTTEGPSFNLGVGCLRYKTITTHSKDYQLDKLKNRIV